MTDYKKGFTDGYNAGQLNFIDEKEEFAIKFSEWICKQGLNSVNIMVNPKWGTGFPSKEYTTKELFELYKEKLNKK